jgi:hypothetical protein
VFDIFFNKLEIAVVHGSGHAQACWLVHNFLILRCEQFAYLSTAVKAAAVLLLNRFANEVEAPYKAYNGEYLVQHVFHALHVPVLVHNSVDYSRIKHPLHFHGQQEAHRVDLLDGHVVVLFLHQKLRQKLLSQGVDSFLQLDREFTVFLGMAQVELYLVHQGNDHGDDKESGFLGCLHGSHA